MKAYKGLILSILIFALTGFIRFRLGFKADYYITSSLYFVLTILTINFFKVKDSRKFCLYEALALLSMYLLGSAIDFLAGEPFELIPDLLFLPNFVSYFCSIFLAYCFITFYKTRIIFIALFVLQMLAYWQYSPYLFRQENFGTYTSKVSEPLPAGLFVHDEAGQAHNIATTGDRYLLVDMWFEGCTPCYKAFPKLEQLYNAQKGKMDIMCVNHPIEHMLDKNFTPFGTVRDLGGTFPVYVADSSLATTLNVITFPTILLIKNNEIIFRGNIEDLNKKYKFY